MTMNAVQACGVVAKNKGEGIVVATMGAMFVLDFIEGADGKASGVPLLGGKLGLALGIGVGKLKSLINEEHAKAWRNSSQQRINSVPLMGGAAGLGLGLALARPDRHVTVIDGDASLLMELGSLATVSQHSPRHFLHCVLHNGTQFTGLDNMDLMHNAFHFADVARAAGYVHAERMGDAAEWARRYPELRKIEGPVFIELMVDPVLRKTKEGFEQEELPPNQYTRMGDEAIALQNWLAGEAA